MIALRTAAGGSSPRVRGTLGVVGEGALDERFIPACAGNSVFPVCRANIPMVHPRVCGELALFHGQFRRMAGSSPRVRGTRRSALNHACRSPVHPRVCGELPCPRFPAEHGLRFIPACAGNSFQAHHNRRMSAVHPRVCGELSASRLGRPALGGSSPRVRGTRVHGCDDCSLGAVHPRVCGELREPIDVVARPSGSSPRVRGTLEVVAQALDRGRFIPACAGNSSRRKSSR